MRYKQSSLCVDIGCGQPMFMEPWIQLCLNCVASCTPPSNCPAEHEHATLASAEAGGRLDGRGRAPGLAGAA
eukprot:SAG11_NODE_31139_length_294_cov_1.051282_1_plen_71_part_10